MSLSVPDGVLAIGVACLLASLLILAVAIWTNRQAHLKSSRPRWQPSDIPLRYEFKNGYLVSDNTGFDCFLTDPEDRTRAWDNLVEGLSLLNPEIGPKMDILRERGQGFRVEEKIGADPVSITGATKKDHLSITVSSLRQLGKNKVLPSETVSLLEDEIDALRQSLDLCTTVMWKCDDGGDVIWANIAYFNLLATLQKGQETVFWPLPNIFAEALGATPDPQVPLSCELPIPDENEDAQARWWEVSVAPLAKGERIFSAIPMDRVMQAEQGKRDSVQTFAKTFAQLTVGLAIFDKSRALVMFNPALVQLTTLSAAWLSGRPLLFDFLDQLREHQRMPEPKNYKAWRENLANIEKGSENGTYQEYWTLPTGQTYRVLGRPHPDGAVALMFEDISSEVSLTRKFRSNLELYQTVLDESPSAIAVFSGDGVMELRNAAFDRLWQLGTDQKVGTLTLREAVTRFELACAPTQIWAWIEDAVSFETARRPWQGKLQLLDGRHLAVTVSPLRSGHIKLEFTLAEPQSHPIETRVERA